MPTAADELTLRGGSPRPHLAGRNSHYDHAQRPVPTKHDSHSPGRSTALTFCHVLVRWKPTRKSLGKRLSRAGDARMSF